MATSKTAFEELVLRITNRLFPDQKPAEQPKWVRYLVTLFGVLTTVISFVIIKFSSMINPTSGNGGDLFFVPSDSRAIQILLISMAVLFFTWLIGNSVRRGTKLNFYLWGVTVPILVITIIRLGIVGI